MIACTECDRIFDDGERLVQIKQLKIKENDQGIATYHFEYPDDGQTDYLCGECWVDMQRHQVTEDG